MGKQTASNLTNTSANKKQTLTDQIYLEIKREIAAQVFQPGEKLNIKELARKYEVSDTPVKQALQRLAEEKIVVSTPNKGMSVRALTPYELDDIFNMRMMMDCFFANDIITTLNYNTALREQLIQNLEEQKKFIAANASSNQPDAYFSLDMEFHMLFLSASGNRKAVEVFQFLQPFTYGAGTYLQQPPSRDRECVEEHTAILDAALCGNLEALRAAITQHLEKSKKALQLIFKTNRLLSADTE